MLASFTTLLVVVGTFTILASNAGFTGFFLKSPPTGERAVGLVIPLAILIGAALLVTLASLLVAFRSGQTVVGLIRASPVASGALTVAVTFGVVVAAFMAFVAWAEPMAVGSKFKAIIPLLGFAAGLIGPALLGLALVIGAWMTPQWLDANPKWLMGLRPMCWTLAAMAVMGYALGGVAVAGPVAQLAHQRSAATSPVDQAAQRKFRNTPAEQLLGEELAKLPSDAPLSEVVVYLVTSRKKLDAGCLNLLVERALRVPDMDQQLLDTMKSRDCIFRWGAAEFVRVAPIETVKDHQEAWSRAVIAGINATAESMTIRPAWLSETFDQNPEPLKLVTSLLGAAERFKGLQGEVQIDEALRRMAKDSNELKQDKKREKLATELKRAGYPVPPETPPIPGPE